MANGIFKAKSVISITVVLVLEIIHTPEAFSGHSGQENLGLSTEWQRLWDQCYDLNLPYFKNPERRANLMSFLKSGDQWESEMTGEILRLKMAPKTVCKTWESRNGSDVLAEFLQKFQEIARQAIIIRSRAGNPPGTHSGTGGPSGLYDQFRGWRTVGDEELKSLNSTFDRQFCGMEFRKFEEHVDSRLQELRVAVENFAKDCAQEADPAYRVAIDGARVVAVQSFGDGGGNRGSRNERIPGTGPSGITGVEKALENAAKGEAILRQQSQEAAQENAKKQGK